MKRFNSILLICVLLMQLFSFNVYAEESTNNKKVDTLIGLNILEGMWYSSNEFDEKYYVTMGGFVNAVLNLVQEDEVFDDHYSDRSMARAEDMALISYMSASEALATIKCGQALDILVRATGYGMLLDNGATAKEAASQIGLSAGGKEAEDPLTNAAMVELLYDALEVHPLVFNLQSYSPDTSMTILEKFKDIIKIRGLVTQNSYTDLTTATVSGGAHLVIGGTTCLIKRPLYDDLLGMYVEAYVKEIDDEYELVYALPVKTETLTLEREDVLSIDASFRNLRYEEDGTSKKLEISPTVKVIYNGIAYTGYQEADFVADNGQLTLIDNDDNGKYDVVKITAYKTIVVQSVSTLDGVITNKYTYDTENQRVQIDLMDSETEYVVVKDGERVLLSDIRAGNVLQVAQPKNKSEGKTFIYASSATAEGIVKGITDDRHHVVTIGENEYILSDAYTNAVSDPYYRELRMGNNYKVYLDSFGKVVFVEDKSVNVVSYGYMNKISINEEDDRCYIQLFSTDGNWYTYPLMENLSYNNVRTADSVVFADLTNMNNKLKKAQMIRYRLNQNNEIKSLETAKTTGKYEDGDFVKKTLSSDYYRSESAVLCHSETYLHYNTTVMVIPADSNNKKGYSIKGLSLFYNGQTISCTAYDVDDWGRCSLITFAEGVEASEGGLRESNFYLVEAVKQVLDSDGDVRQQAVVHKPGYGRVTLLSDEQNRFTGIMPGDLIQVATDSNSVATGTRVVYSRSSGETMRWSGINSWYDSSMVSGRIVDVDFVDSLVRINNGSNHVAKTNGNPGVIIYDSASNTATRGSMNDLLPGDYIVAEVRRYRLINATVYR